jgi:hypothetical protein
MAFCGHCGTQVDDGLEFCPRCGKAVTTAGPRRRRRGSDLIVAHGSSLPPNCVKCAQPVVGAPREKTFTWYNPWLNLLILAGGIGWVILLIAYYSARKQMALGVPLCDNHQRQRRTRLLVGTLLLLVSPWLLVLGGLVNNEDVLAFGGIVLTLQVVVGIVVLVRAAPLRSKRIDDHEGVFKGAGEAFLRLVETQG